jgi:hypothetical protein
MPNICVVCKKSIPEGLKTCALNTCGYDFVWYKDGVQLKISRCTFVLWLYEEFVEQKKSTRSWEEHIAHMEGL